MSDDLRVRSPNTYAVRASTTKRDHLTDSAVNSVPERTRGRRERKRRGDRDDRADFSMEKDLEHEDHDEAPSAPAEEEQPPRDAENTQPERGESPRDDDDAKLGPGSILDVTA